MFKVILYKDNQAEDITKQVSELNWSENLDTVGANLSFNVSDVVDRYITRLAIVAGDIISLYNDNEQLIRGIVVNVTRD